MSEQATSTVSRELVATAALALFSLVVAANFARVFSGWEFLPDLVVIVVIGHFGAFALRRLTVSGWVSIPLLTVFLLWYLIISQYGDTAGWLLPTGETFDRLGLELSVVRDQFQTAVAPVPYGSGWAVLAGFAMVMAVMMADSFAFLAEARGESLVPGGVLFVFVAALGSPRLQIGLTVCLVAAGVLAVAALRAYHDRSRRVELGSARRSVSLTVPAAIGSAVAIALLAGFVGPRLPGAHAEPLYDTRGRGGGITEVISPLVDIRSRLTNRSNVEMFRVNADSPSYWRATTLPEFDGRTFRLPRRSLERVEGAFGASTDQAEQIRQRIQVLSLGGVLLPAAAEPIQAEGDQELRLNRDTSTLVTPDELTSGNLFTVVSAAPRPTPDQLRVAGTANPPDPIFLDLPDMPDVVSRLAGEVTAGAATDYDRALALQNWFRSEFEYSLEVQSGHGTNAIEVFLEQRIGYCEQFAATFAAMARTLDIPTRVAVGFTPGTLRPDGWYAVLGKNAHAWPEVWFEGIGWVPFEPTPSRGIPGSEQITNVAAAQDDSAQEFESGDGGATVTAPPPPPSTVVPPVTTVPIDRGAPIDQRAGPGIPDLEDGASGGASEGPGVPWLLLGIIALVVAAVAAPWAARQYHLRSARSHGSSERVLAAWTRARDSATRAGVAGSPSMTAHEWAAATAAHLPVAARPMSSLADVVDQIAFAPPGAVDLDRRGAFGATLGHDCELWSQQVTSIADDTLTPAQRVREHFTNWG